MPRFPVCIISGKTGIKECSFESELDMDSSVLMLKEAVERRFAIPVEDQRVIWVTKELPNNVVFKETNYSPVCMLQVIGRFGSYSSAHS